MQEAYERVMRDPGNLLRPWAMDPTKDPNADLSDLSGRGRLLGRGRGFRLPQVRREEPDEAAPVLEPGLLFGKPPSLAPGLARQGPR
jgi:hypothetical protein